jgi:hypothetical protein
VERLGLGSPYGVSRPALRLEREWRGQPEPNFRLLVAIPVVDVNVSLRWAPCEEMSLLSVKHEP